MIKVNSIIIMKEMFFLKNEQNEKELHNKGILIKINLRNMKTIFLLAKFRKNFR